MRRRGQGAAISLENVEDAIVVHAVHLALHVLVVVQVAQHQIDGEATRLAGRHGSVLTSLGSF